MLFFVSMYFCYEHNRVGRLDEYNVYHDKLNPSLVGWRSCFGLSFTLCKVYGAPLWKLDPIKQIICKRKKSSWAKPVVFLPWLEKGVYVYVCVYMKWLHTTHPKYHKWISFKKDNIYTLYPLKMWCSLQFFSNLWRPLTLQLHGAIICCFCVCVCVFLFIIIYIFLCYKTNPCLLQLLRMLQGRFAVELQKCFVDYTNSPDLLFVGGWADNDWIHMYGWTCIIYSPILSRSVYFHRHSWCLNDEQWAIMHCGLFWIAADTRYHKYTISGVKCCVYFCQFC